MLIRLNVMKSSINQKKYDLNEDGHAIDCSGHSVLDMLLGILNEGWKRSFLGGSRK
ncbi:hypothetical protein RO3G_12208 [Rhizopus delemar RA 99-880]|uniref:Uncharacterized protein n=1 Tax=Rhizopus delemar (strain RA 99-880 / ATCC MYA-4621 / FGSC 9543 / NRRL 43880) TaxID=246409 RepID=I1CGB7_RHIO9|nr:hypothetical protein RO3G_12208 [Rhizopus delemar RA 99-880]|eukprot:EIE87497.1 hypothetical protein RO3G_12208 [Rhizopus delemar RA 99-880]